MTNDKDLLRLKELEQELSKTKYNKRTEHAIGLLKAKIAKLKEKIEAKQTKSKSTRRSCGIRKHGDATVVIVGPPSVGKSSLLNVLTNKKSMVGDYDFTTVEIIPGIMHYQGARIQILDIPGIISGASSGKGRGKEVLSVVRNADLIIILTDIFRPAEFKRINKELYAMNIRINKTKPDVKIVKKTKGGINIISTMKLDQLGISKSTIITILKEFRIINADVIIRCKITIDDFIDILRGNVCYVPALKIINKFDLVNSLSSDEKAKLDKIMDEVDLLISSKDRTNINILKELIFNKLNLIRVYLKEPKKEPNLNEPMILKSGSTILDLCNKIHKNFSDRLKYARVWGTSVKFQGQQVYLKHKLKDKDIVELHIR